MIWYINRFTYSVLQCKCIDPDNLGEPTGCVSPAYKGDGNCDDGNNNEGCEYDGGDCCATTAKNGKVKTKYCKKVIWEGENFARMRYRIV